MVFVMDKMKEHSCAIQPAFGFGGLGLNFAFMLDQVFNPLMDDDDTLTFTGTINFPPLPFNTPNLGPIDFNPFTNQLLNQQPLINNINPLSTEQSNQDTGNQQQQQPTIVELVANAIQQHVATHHAALLNNTTGTAANAPDNAHQPQLNLSDMVQVQPITTPGVAQAVQFQATNDTQGNHPISVTADQPQVFFHLPSTNAIEQYILAPLQTPFNLSNLADSGLAEILANSEMIETIPEAILNMPDTVPINEDSNSSVSQIQAPFSSPAYPFSPGSSNEAYPFSPSSSNEGEPPVASNIVIIDSVENPENVDESQSNHADVPN